MSEQSDKEDWELFFKNGIETIAGQRHEILRLQSKNRWAKLDIAELVNDFGVRPMYWNGAHQAFLNETNVPVEFFKTNKECRDWCDEKNKDATETPTIEIEQLKNEVIRLLEQIRVKDDNSTSSIWPDGRPSSQ